MPRTMTKLSLDEVRNITKLFRGERPGVPNPSTAAVARRFDITEANKAPCRAAATSAAPAAKRPTTPSVTESVPDLKEAADAVGAYGARKAALAAKLSVRVQAAESKPIHECSIQELEALAAATGSEAGMFGA